MRPVVLDTDIGSDCDDALALGVALAADDNVAFLHDPLTALALDDAPCLEFEDLVILPTILGGVLRTIEADPAWGVGARMRVATGVDSDAARAAIAKRLLHA